METTLPIPSFNEYGLLPHGTFDASKEEIVERYCGNPNRSEIWTKFIDFCDTELLPLNYSNVVLVDGGFTSDKIHTGDIDVVLDVASLGLHDLFNIMVWQAENHDRIKLTYATDFWIYHPSIPQDLRLFFQYVKETERLQRGAPDGQKKGLLRVLL